MGFSGTFVYDGNDWYDVDPDKVGPSRLSAPSLWLNIHDSDLAQLSYQPAGPGTGTAFLGFTPRVYFDDVHASAPTDVAREAAGLAAWVAAVVGAPAPGWDLIEPWLATDAIPDQDVDDDSLSDAEIFVEIKAAQFLAFLGVPVPEYLAR